MHFFSVLFDDIGGIPANDAILRHIFDQHRSGTDRNIVADFYAAQYERAGTDFHIIADDRARSFVMSASDGDIVPDLTVVAHRLGK